MTRSIATRRLTRGLLILAAGALCAGGCGRGCRKGEGGRVLTNRLPLPTRTLAVGPAPRVQITTLGGAVKVTAGAAGTVRLTGEAEGRAAFREEAAALARGVPIRLATGPDGTALIEARPMRGRGVGASAHLVVEVPADAQLTITSRGSGAITVQGVTGGVRVEVVDGAVTLRDVGGAVAVTTRKQGAVEARGAITALDVQSAGAVRIETTAGRLGADGRVRARRGDVAVVVPSGFAGVVDVEAAAGNVKDDFDLPRTPSGAILDGRVGAGGARLSIQARRGDAELRRR